MTTHLQRRRLVTRWAATTSLIVTVAGAAATVDSGALAASTLSDPVVETEGGSVGGVAADGGFVFRGVPYAAPPTGPLRWQAPQPAPSWDGVRDATEFVSSCPQQAGPFAPPGSLDEDCLSLNVYTPALGNADTSGRPVLVWIHGGGLASDAARNYDPTLLAAEGTVVVTINYRLGAFGFLSHPAVVVACGRSVG